MSSPERTASQATSNEKSFLAGALASARRALGDDGATGAATDDLPLASVTLGAQHGDGRTLAGRVIARLAERQGHARYRIEGEIDHGGQGRVLRVRDEELMRELAMKTLHSEGAPASGTTRTVSRAVARFLEEALVTGQLDHPGIVPVHELGLDADGRVFFTMKLVRGEDLRAALRKVRAESEGWTRARALGVVLKVCEAMAYAHAKGVIHRDLKPANVMVGRFGEVYVMDWGLARVLGSAGEGEAHAAAAEMPEEIASVRDRQTSEGASPPLTLDGQVLGTPAYMASEQALGKLDEIGPHTDVHAVGAILYEILAGHAPYLEPGAEPANHALWRRVRAGPPVPLGTVAPDAPSELVAIAEKAMARDWRRRYPDMGALAEDLRAWLEVRVVHAYEAGRFAELRKWIARNRLFSVTAALALVLIVTGTSTASLVLAGKNRALARAQLDGDELVLLGLEQQARELGSAEPANEPRYAGWLALGDQLVARVNATHRPTLAGLDAGSTTDDRAARTRHLRLADFVARVDAFTGQDGTRARVAALHEFALTVRERSLDGPDARTRWQAAQAAIEASPAYEGLELAPQLGLLPLGEDPESGLWEFWHVGTGNEPRRDASTGRAVLAKGDGVILVLVPGGPTSIGAQSTDRNGVRFDSFAPAVIEDLHELELAPFFVAKYELTQDQWMRATGSNPSAYNFHRYDPPSLFGQRRLTCTHPVESVSWEETSTLLARYGLTLPSEAQWEHAARSWTDTIWWTGDAPASLDGAENLADQSLRTQLPAEALLPWNDSYQTHAPVGSFAPNPFGLHDMGGNVKEWCLDWLGQYAHEGFTAGTGERVVTAGADRVVRGGCFMDAAAEARSAGRGGIKPRAIHDTIGVRPARAIAAASD